MPILQSKNLTTKFGVKTILNNITLSIEQGEHTILFGLNGCGKTTLLATLCGYMGYSSGNISIFNTDLSDENVISLRKSIGFVSNSYFNRLYSTENVIDIVLGAPFGELVGRWDTTTEQVLRAKTLLKCFGLRAKACYPYDLLSYGQQQRVLLARALMVPPKLLILDEPCSGLDVLTRKFLLNTISNIAKEEGTTIICATHYAEEILPCFTNGILMKNGKIFKEGPIEKVFTSETLSTFFSRKTTCQHVNNIFQFTIDDKYCIDNSILM